MESFFSRYRNALVLIAVLLAQVIGLAVQVRRPDANTPDKGSVRLIRSWVVNSVTPPERFFHWIGKSLRGTWSNYIDLIHVRRQNQDLKAELDRLRLEEDSLAEDARQGQRLQTLLGFTEKYIYQTVAAQVIGTSGTEQSHVLLIDKGSQDGLKPDMPVITPDGIVGKTRDVFRHTSQVLEISDVTSGAGVILEKTRIRGVLRGDSWGQPEIVNVSPDERIQKGETVLTSGGDAIYPRGLSVGTVDRVSPQPEGTLVNVLVKPAANLGRLEEVLVITTTGSQMPAEMQQDLSDAQQKASDVLAERLPSRIDPNLPADQQQDKPPGGRRRGCAASGAAAARRCIRITSRRRIRRRQRSLFQARKSPTQRARRPAVRRTVFPRLQNRRQPARQSRPQPLQPLRLQPPCPGHPSPRPALVRRNRPPPSRK